MLSKAFHFIASSRPRIFAFFLTIHLLGSWALPLVDRDEPRFAEAAREMMQRGDWIVPWFNDKHRYDKPPLTYWLQIPAYKLFGENEFAARLHSAIAAAAVSLLLVEFGRRAFNPLTGSIAAFVFGFSLQVLVHAKAAVADMLMVLCLTAAAWAGWELIRIRNGSEPPGGSLDWKQQAKPWWWLFYVALAIGFLAKGPIAWIPLGSAALYIWITRSWRSERKVFKPLAGAALLFAIIGAWVIPALIKTDFGFFHEGFYKHIIHRSFKPMEGHGASDLPGYLAMLPLYFVTIFASFFPWSVYLPGMARHWSARENRRGVELYLIISILLVFIIFSLIKTKLPHYTLPAFPMLALLAARFITLRSRESAFLKWSAGMTAFVVILAFILFPIGAQFFPSKQFATLAREHLDPRMEFASSDFNEPSLVWYFRKHVSGFHRSIKPSQAIDYMQKRGPRFVILKTEDAARLFPNEDDGLLRFRVSGLNVVKGKPIDLTMILKQAQVSPATSPADRG